MIGLSYVPLSKGVSLLREHTSEIVWRGRSLFLCGGCDDVLPFFRVSAISDVDSKLESTAHSSGTRRVALAFEADEKTRQWAAKCGAKLLLPPHEVVSHVGDKTCLPEILECANLRPIPSSLYEARSYPDAKRILLEFGGAPVVVQRRANNLTGRGTRLVSDWRELSQVFAEWGEERLKVSQYIDGILLTISGCVGPTQTIVSAISKQFVGTPRLTCFWGAHCGNQLIKSAELGDQIAALCFDACKKVGDELRRRGFLGVFGLDLMRSRENEVLVVEINPRLQSVSSLVNVAEIEAGMLPLPGVHLLSFLLEKMPVTTFADAPAVPPLSQVVLYARRKGLILEAPESGRYRLEEGGLARAVGPPSLRYLSNKEALVWSFVKSGEYAQEDTRLCVLQTRFYLAEEASKSILTDVALKWVDALEALFKYLP